MTCRTARSALALRSITNARLPRVLAGTLAAAACGLMAAMPARADTLTVSQPLVASLGGAITATFPTPFSTLAPGATLNHVDLTLDVILSADLQVMTNRHKFPQLGHFDLTVDYSWAPDDPRFSPGPTGVGRLTNIASTATITLAPGETGSFTSYVHANGTYRDTIFGFDQPYGVPLQYMLLHTTPVDLTDINAAVALKFDSGTITAVYDFTPAVPEPSSWALMLAGGVGLAAWARRQRQPQAAAATDLG